MPHQNQTHTLQIHYGGVAVELKFDETVHAELRIKHIVRDSVDSDNNPTRLVLTTTLQTDYEWHEFIEGIIEYHPDKIHAVLRANKTEIASMEVPRTASQNRP